MRANSEPSTALISVIMANFNGAGHLAESIRSVLEQSYGNLELIISDDASSDDSVTIAKAFAMQDSRVKVVTTDNNAGPARARNKALDEARGEWIAIVDSDDILHPDRLLHLIEAASRERLDIVADELMFFFEDSGASALMFTDEYASGPFSVTPEFFIRCNSGEANLPNLGYLKPLIRAELAANIRYDETLQIGEDYDFLLRLLLNGANFVVLPIPSYFYRRHSQSISHRMGADRIAAMITNHLKQQAAAVKALPHLQAIMNVRRRSLEAGWRFENLVSAIKRREPVKAASLVMKDPSLLVRLATAFSERFTKIAARRKPAQATIRILRLRETPATGDEPIRSDFPEELSRLAPSKPFEENFKYGNREDWCALANIGTSAPLTVLVSGPNSLYAAGYIRAKRLEEDIVESTKSHA